jgi:hypothetical protein
MTKHRINYHRSVLLIDAVINLLLGILLGFYPETVIGFLGLPVVSNPFYASILGGVLFGIGIALLIEHSKKLTRFTGLGLTGAMAINLSGGFVLAFWLCCGDLDLPMHGKVIMWSLVLILILISLVEFIIGKRS